MVISYRLPTALRPRVIRCAYRDQKGIAALEFALLAAPLLLLICSIIEFGLIMFEESLLNGIISDISRTGTVGYAPNDTSREQYLINQIKSGASGLINPDLLNIEVKSYGKFSDINKPEPYADENGNEQYDAGELYTDVNGDGKRSLERGKANDAGSAGQVVSYTVTYPHTVIIPLLQPFMGHEYRMTAVWVVRNEPADLPDAN